MTFVFFFDFLLKDLGGKIDFLFVSIKEYVFVGYIYNCICWGMQLGRNVDIQRYTCLPGQFYS